MDRLINVNILRNPLNWLTVVLMTMVGLFAADAVIRLARQARGKSPQTGE